MMRIGLARLLLLAVALAPAACAGRLETGGASPAGGSASRRAALARLSVHNETGGRLVIAFREAAPPGPSVIVGTAFPDTTLSLAPVPAGEPIILTATRDDGAALRLPPRSFAPDEDWLWVIPRDARFEP